MSADGQQEPSMEDILASIRKILSEDEAEAPKPEPPKAAPPPLPPPPEPEPEASIFDEVPEEPGPDIQAVDPEPLQLSMEQQVAPQEPVYEQPQQQYQPQQYQPQDYPPQQYLVGDPAAQAAGASIAQLANAVSRERAIALGNSGITLEQLVREICTPILKDWLDTNLPYMVERIVKQEMERIVNRSDVN
ncbi:MAG: DUF2497 domain-containing protein [Rhodospirillaceae bacterium]|nr:DUF2497 domain-containing protein [Rhodospirillaceae bacterium]